MRFMSLIIESQSFQNPGRMFFHARGASRRLFRPGEMQQITFLPSEGERMKGFSQIRVIIQTLLKLLGHIELCHASHRHLGAGFLNCNDLPDVCLNRRFLLVDLRKRSKPDLPRGLHILGLLNEDALRVFQQSAFHEQQGAIILEAVDQNHFAAI